MAPLRHAAAWLLVLALTAGCSAGQQVTPAPTSAGPVPAPSSPEPTVTAETPSPTPTPTPTPTPLAPTGKVAVDDDATLEVKPVDYGGTTLVVAGFGKPERVARRPVVLQRKAGKAWQEVATGRLTKSGTVEFLAPAEPDTFRVVALAADDRAVIATPSVAADDQWKQKLDSGFPGSSLKKPWDQWTTAGYNAGGRWCSAPVARNVVVADGAAALLASRASKKVTTRVNAEARRKQARAGQKVVGCPEGVWDNSQVSTRGHFTMRSGTVAARVKFSPHQGAHSAVWLYADDGNELDMIESYGYGLGLTNVIHLGGKRTPADAKDSYVLAEQTSDPQWWEEWHTVSVEWDRNGVVFRLDGVKTRELKQRVPRSDFYVVLSQLSSDWETKRVTKPSVTQASGVDLATVETPELPISLQVDWVRAWERRD